MSPPISAGDLPPSAEGSRCFADAVRRHEERTKAHHDAVAAREVRRPTAGAIDDEQLMFNELRFGNETSRSARSE